MTTSRQTPEITAEDIDLSVPLDTICFIIEKAREFDVKTSNSDPDATALDDEDPEAAVLEDRPSDPVKIELDSVIADLSDDAQLDLVTLMWIGRGDGSVAEWSDLRRIARNEKTSATAQYLTGTPLLADYLEAGLDALGLDCSEYYETSL